MTKDGRAKIEQMADQAGLSIAEFMRSSSLGEKITIIEGIAASDDMKEELHRIGVGINQIAKAANSGLPYSEAELEQYCRDLNILLESFED